MHLTESYLPCTPLSEKFIWNDDYDNISWGAFFIHASEVSPVENKSWHICFPVQLATLAALKILILQAKLQKNLWKEDCPELQGCRNAKSVCNGTIIQRGNIFNNKHAVVDTFFFLRLQRFSWGYNLKLISLKSLLMFSLMLQGHIETNDWFQMVGRIRGVRESKICAPCPSNSLFLHSLLYILLENVSALISPQPVPHPFHLGDFLDPYSADFTEGIQRCGSLCGTQLGHEI